MAEPTLTEAERAAVVSAKETADFGAKDAADQEIALQSVIQIQENLDSGLKRLQDYNTSVIDAYEEERRRLSGVRTQLPLTDLDYDQFVNLVPGARLGTLLTPNRISQFDLNPTSTTESGSELVQIARQAELQGYLRSGFSYPEPALTCNTLTAVSNGSSSLTTEPTASSFGIVIGQWLLISSGSSAAVLKVNGVTEPFPSVSGSTSLSYEWIVPPNTTIGSGATLNGSFPGFSNGERASKSSGTRQRLMDQWVSDLQASLNLHTSAISSEISAIQGNGNEYLDRSNIGRAQTHAQKIAAYLGVTPPSTMDISDTGFSVLSAMHAVRSIQISARVTQISYELANGPKGSFLDRRYSLVVSRFHLGNGSYRILLSLRKTKDGATAKKTIATALSERWASFL